MSKSKGNILDPIVLINEYGSDGIRYYLMKDVIFGSDGTINIDNLQLTLNDLANNIGNLSNRIFTILTKNFDCKVPEPSTDYTLNEYLYVDIKKISSYMEKYELHNYTKFIHQYSSTVNKYVNDNEPWNKKNNSEQNIKNIIHSTLISLKNIFILLYPIMPLVSVKFLKNLNIFENDINITLINKMLNFNEQLSKPEILFKKYD